MLLGSDMFMGFKGYVNSAGVVINMDIVIGWREWRGTPGRIRTRDPLLRRQPLYPSELQGRVCVYELV